MPVSIVATLMLWSSCLAPSASFDRILPAAGDQAAFATSLAAQDTSIRSCPGREPFAWSLPDADTQEEETGDGDPEGLVSDAPWASLALSCTGQGSPIRRDRGIVSRPSRSQILRC
jgi:hypothetical protein